MEVAGIAGEFDDDVRPEFVVSELPPSMEAIILDYANLSENQVLILLCVFVYILYVGKSLLKYSIKGERIQ
jgi:hypothetical protein